MRFSGTEQMYQIVVDDYDHGILISALNDMRNDMIRKNKDTSAVDDLILLIYGSPKKKMSAIQKELVNRG